MRNRPQHFSVESEGELFRRRNRKPEQKLARQTPALECRVQERMAQLSHEALRAEIAERERMEDELRRSKKRYHMRAANFPNGAVIMLDRDLWCVLAERAGLEAVGISKEFLVGKTIRRFRRKQRRLCCSRTIAPLQPARQRFSKPLARATRISCMRCH
jgi:PAS domain-containing protein